MEVISFDIIGKFAHFRRFYSNSTALSFTIPPRTTLMGMLASVLGRERDSYYEALSSDNIMLALDVGSSIKKTFHRVNYLSIKSITDFRGKNGRIQTPLEVVTGENIRKDEVIYRIYIGHTDSGRDVFENLKSKLLSNEQQYNLSLGIANFSAAIQNIITYNFDDVKKKEVENAFVVLNSCANTATINELKVDFEEYSFVEEDLLPADFKGNLDREVSKMNRVVYMNGKMPLRVIMTGTYFELSKDDSIKKIQFLS